MRDCKNCKHLIMYDYKNKSYSCELGECEFEPEEQEPTTKNLAADREDTVERLNAIKQFIGYDKDSEIVKATQKSLDMAIKALEQEPVLDKIRAEIKALTSNRGFLSCSVDHIHEEIDAVFDKYKAETEET